MRYISCEEMGNKLGLSRRRVQQLCAQGKIPGVERIGRDWLIPALPGNSSISIQEELRFFDGFPLCPVSGTDYIHPEMIVSLQEGQQLYLSGKARHAFQVLEPLLDHSIDIVIRLAAALTCNLSSMYLEDTAFWYKANLALSQILDVVPEPEKSLFRFAPKNALYNVKDCPDWLKQGAFDTLPQALIPYAAVQYVQYYMLTEAYNQDLTLLEPLCTIVEWQAPGALSIYMHLMMAIIQRNADHVQMASNHVNKALDMALDSNCFAPLAELWTNLGTLLTVPLRGRGETIFNSVQELHFRLVPNWHRLFTLCNVHQDPTRGITTPEAEIANYVALGKTNAEIAKLLHYSDNTVRSYLETIYQKTGVHSRSELKKVFLRGNRGKPITENEK